MPLTLCNYITNIVTFTSKVISINSTSVLNLVHFNFVSFLCRVIPVTLAPYLNKKSRGVETLCVPYTFKRSTLPPKPSPHPLLHQEHLSLDQWCGCGMGFGFGIKNIFLLLNPEPLLPPPPRFIKNVFLLLYPAP